MRHVMLDLETWGTGHQALIVQIGAVCFDLNTFEMGRTCCINIDPRSAPGSVIDADTVAWWVTQSDEARKSILGPSHCEVRSGDRVEVEKPLDIDDALGLFERFLPSELKGIWGNGSNFDNRILREAFEAYTGLGCPWHYTRDRDMRTYMALHPKVYLERAGIHHNGLDDAIHQVRRMEAAHEAKG